MQVFTACIVIIILDLNFFEAHCQSSQDQNNFQTYLKKTFAVLKNEKLSRNMRSLLKNLKQDELRRKFNMRRKKQVLMSSNLKDNPLFILSEQQPVAQPLGLNNLNGLISNSLFGKNYEQSHTRASNFIDGFDINAIDKTDAQIVGALYYPSSSSNLVAPNKATDELNSENPSEEPATTVHNEKPNFNYNQIPISVSNDLPQQSGYYYNNNYMKNYLENIKMVPIYPMISNSPPNLPPNEQPIDAPVVTGDNPKRCSTQDYDSSQKEGLYGIFSEIYKNLKLNSIITTTPSENHNENCPSNSINLLNSKLQFGTANEPIEQTNDNNPENQYKNVLNPAVMGSIMSCIKSIIEKQNKRLNKCNSNLPQSYQNVFTPHLMSLIVESLANSITPKNPSAENVIPNDYLDQFISRSTSEKSFPEENYLDKLSRYDLGRQIENKNFHFDLNSLLNVPDKNKESIYTNSPKLLQSKYELSKSISGRVERSTTLRQKVIPKNIMPSEQNIGLHKIQPKLSIFSNLNFPKRCENNSGENDTNSKNIEKEAFNTSSAIEEILNIVQEMRNKEKQLSEDVNCNILGSWSSMAGGMLINVSKSGDILDISLNEKSPPGKKGFLMDPGWIIKGVQPIPKTNLIILTGTNLNTKHVIVFIGECRVCGGSELVTGNWLIGRCSHNCQDQKASQDLLSDVWRREMLTKLFNDRLNAMSKLVGHKKGESDTSSHHITTVATTTVCSNDTSMTTDNNISTCNTTEAVNNSSSTDEVCSDQPSNATTGAGMEENGKNQSSNGTTCMEENGKKQPSNVTTVASMEENGQNQAANATTVLSTEEICQNETTSEQKLDTTTCKTTNEPQQTKNQKSETTCNATEEDLNFLFSSSSATTAAGESGTSTDQGRKSILGNIECSNNSSQGAESANKTTTCSDNKSTKGDTDKKNHTGNKMFTLCNYNNKAAATKKHHEKTKKTTPVKCTTTPLSTTCEPTTTENTSSPSTSCEETTKTNDTSTNKCVVEIDINPSTKSKFLSKVIHIFKNKSKTTTTEKC